MRALLLALAIVVSCVPTDDQVQTDYGGVGITYGGKVGVEVAPNLYIDMDGGIGFGP